ncbi:MAG: molybdate ABC transporter permease subunit [Polyangiaceae bacterium]
MIVAPLVLTFEVAAIATVIGTAIGVALGAFLGRPAFRGRNVLDVLVTSPMVLPPTVLGYYVLVVLGRRSPIGMAYEALTGSTIVFSVVGAIVAAVLGVVPIVAKGSRAALESVDGTFVLAARTLGASPTRAFFTVHVPLAMRGISASIALAFARSLGDFGVTLMVAGDIPGETQTASLAIYDAIQAHRDHDALLMIGVLTAVAFVVLYVAARLGHQDRFFG